MATFSRVLLSGSTAGRPIKITSTADPGTAIHTAVAGSASFDELYLWATNTSSGAVTITTQWGGNTDPDNLITKAYSIPANSAPTALIVGQVLNSAQTCSAFASTANAIVISGFVTRIA